MNVKAGVLGLAGLAGVVALLWVVASTVLGWQLVVFRTGSMAPSMPTGAAALTVPVSPPDIRIGDVVTVRRAGADLPVTHRVVSVAAQPGDPAARRVVLQGDANRSPDVVPYDVTTASRVLIAVPGAGAAIEATRTPLFLGAATILVASLVTWAFWPQRARAHRADPGARRIGPDAEQAR